MHSFGLFRQLYVDKVKGLISAEDFVELSKEFTEERERMKRLIAEGEGRIPMPVRG